MGDERSLALNLGKDKDWYNATFVQFEYWPYGIGKRGGVTTNASPSDNYTVRYFFRPRARDLPPIGASRPRNDTKQRTFADEFIYLQ